MKGSKNWTTLVKSTNEQIQCAKHGEPNQAASQVKFGQYKVPLGGVWKKGEKKKAKKA